MSAAVATEAALAAAVMENTGDSDFVLLPTLLAESLLLFVLRGRF